MLSLNVLPPVDIVIFWDPARAKKNVKETGCHMYNILGVPVAFYRRF